MEINYNMKETIACIGDSITFGSGVLSPKKNSYPAILGRLLGERYEIFNYGLPGRTALRSGDQPYAEEREYRKSLERKASTYIIMLGTNDSKTFNWKEDEYPKDLEELVRTYKDLPNVPKILLMKPPKAFPVLGGIIRYDIQDSIIRHEICEDVGTIATKYNFDVVDLYHLTKDHPEWFVDGVHPNKEGNQAIAERIKTFL